jgi:hypothetical protein
MTGGSDEAAEEGAVDAAVVEEGVDVVELEEDVSMAMEDYQTTKLFHLPPEKHRDLHVEASTWY